MSEHFVHAYNDLDGNSGHSMPKKQSAWMSHWTRKSYKESCHGSNEYLLTGGKEIAAKVCSPARGLGGIETGGLKMKNESLKMTSTTTGTDARKFQYLPPCKNDESGSNGKDSQAASDTEALWGHQINHNLDFDRTTLSLQCYIPPRLSVAPDADMTPSKDHRIEAEGMLHNTKEHVESYSFFGDSSHAIPRPLSKVLDISSTDMVQCRLDHGNERISFFPSQVVSRPALAPEEQLPQANPSFVDSEILNFRRHSSVVVCEEKIGSCSKPGRPSTSYQLQNKASSFETGPCKINHHLPASGQEHFREAQNASGIRIFWNQPNHSQATKLENLYHGCSSSQKFPHSLHDLDSMRICTTTLDSIVPLHEVQPRFSQTTHNLLIRKRTDIDSFNLKVSLRNLRESADSAPNTILQLHGIPPPTGSGAQGVKIESLCNSDSEGKENVGDPLGRHSDAKAVKGLENSADGKGKKVIVDPDLKNESSAETDTMDLDDFKEKNQPLSCVNSARPIEVLKLGLVTSQYTFGSTSKCKQHEGKLPVTDLELPALPASNNGDASSSRTQSLDMETVFTQAEPLNHSRSDRCLGVSVTTEPSCRWIKRLKYSVSEPYSLGTKCSTDEEWSHHEKKSSGKNVTDSLAHSEPTASDLHGKDLMVLDKSVVSERLQNSISAETSEQARPSLTSQSWIRRWCRSNYSAPQQQEPPETVVACEPQSSKLAFEEDIQAKQFPSIAAMALMGRAMRGFQPCDFKKKGSVIVWNARTS